MAKKPTAIVASGAQVINWNDEKMVAEVRKIYGKDLNDHEFSILLGIGKASGLNPFMKEIWAVKYGNNAASIFVGRDGYRKSAQAHAEYEYHYAMAVYANDVFEVIDGQPKHNFTLKERGKIVGAYCVVKRKSSARAVMNWVDFSEYVQTFGVWKTKPATMIAKVAEAQGLRASFQELFAGTFEASESWDEAQVVDMSQGAATLPSKPIVEAAATAQEQEPARVTKDTLQRIGAAWREYTAAFGITKEESKNAGQSKIELLYGKTDISALTEEEGQKFAEILTSEVAVLDAQPKQEEKAKPATQKTLLPEDDIPPGKIRADQTKKMYAVWKEYAAAAGITDSEESIERRRELIAEMFSLTSSTKLNEHQAEDLIARIQEMTREASM